jgi:hypothetical protein
MFVPGWAWSNLAGIAGFTGTQHGHVKTRWPEHRRALV